ncbi:SMI1/KNR4 family protein [Streptomyces sp. SM10]|uniref:SMI1/KNR4 family protein n=1 Tax=Streptomyces sp. SM10 TaxID=565556 RepID=UPI000CD546BC|nr:SMI1/KNR4 family protein [Streptomyces sp. SM10]
MTPTTSPTDPLPTVADSWARIDAWLSEHAPLSRARLRPPAPPEAIADAEERLGLTFHPELVASLRCHDGVELEDSAPVFGLYGPFAGVSGIVENTLFLRSVGEDVEDDHPDDDDDDDDAHELNAFWRHEWLLITHGISWDAQDGLFLTCRAGEDHGRLGRYFDEDAPSFSAWASLRAALSVFADSLEQRLPVGGRVPLAPDGALIWEDATRTVKAAPVSPLALAADTPEPDPEPARPEPEPPRSGTYVTMGPGASRPPEPPQPDLVFAEGVTAEELLRRAGVVQRETVRTRSHAHAERSAASPWAASRPLVRAGCCGDWGFLAQSAGAPQLTRPEVLRGLSRDTRVVAVAKRGPEVRLTVYDQGLPYADGAQDRLVSSPREDYVRLPDGREFQSLGVDPWPGSTAAYTDFLAGLRGGFGIDFDLGRALIDRLPSGLVLPVLDDLPEWSLGPCTEVRQFALGELVDSTPPPRLRAAMAAQLRRLAAETGLDTFSEVTAVLASLDRGETAEFTEGSALDLRMRTLVAEAEAARPATEPSWRRSRDAPELLFTIEDFQAWQLRADAADTLRRFLELPVPVAAASVLHRRLSEDWRGELAEDLAPR